MKEMKEYIVQYVKECRCEAVVKGRNEADARKRFDEGEQEDETEIDTLNIDVKRVSET